jgi:hypothetical protein
MGILSNLNPIPCPAGAAVSPCILMLKSAMLTRNVLVRYRPNKIGTTLLGPLGEQLPLP